jgi:hypothetical protein
LKQEEIIDTIKSTYSRDIRKNLIKSIIKSEKSKNSEMQDKQYKIINQIFSYVIKQSNWKISQNSNNLDTIPMEIMLEVFPKLSSTKWYKEQNVVVKNSVDVVMGDE